MRVTSFINLENWKKARWWGTVFVVTRQETSPPSIGLLFRDEEAGRKIFEDWIRTLGRGDEFDLLRISIIEGDVPGKEPGYSVYIGTDSENYLAYLKDQEIEDEDQLLISLGRSLRVNPAPNSPFLAGFKKRYAHHKKCLLVPCSGPQSQPVPNWDLSIAKNKVNFLRSDELTGQDNESIILKNHEE
jgi:hypothetical protein